MLSSEKKFQENRRKKSEKKEKYQKMFFFQSIDHVKVFQTYVCLKILMSAQYCANQVQT